MYRITRALFNRGKFLYVKVKLISLRKKTMALFALRILKPIHQMFFLKYL
jgi:hypothetical protein